MTTQSLAMRLARKFGLDMDAAEKLVAAGLDTPAKVKEASKTALRKAVGAEVLKKLKP
jgi:hypothetical protein